MQTSLLVVKRGVGLSSLGLLASCSVYAPLQSSAPALREKGQAEIAGSAYLAGRLEGSATYAPARHMLVRAAGGWQPGRSDSASHHFQIRQLELGAGTYWPLSDQWVVGGLGGYGRGNSSRHFTRGVFESISDTARTYRYEARFRKLYGEVFAVYEGEWTTFGLSYRLSRVSFPTLTNNGVPVNLRYMTRSEPMVYLRTGNRQGVLRWLQFQLAVSLAWSPDQLRRNTVGPEIFDTKEARIYTSFGLVLYPHRFKEKW